LVTVARRFVDKLFAYQRGGIQISVED